jgi:hypothetical protein
MQSISCRQYKARHAKTGLAQFMQQAEAIAIRQPPIEDQGLVRDLLHRRPGAVDATGHVHGNASSLQPLTHQPGQALVVLDQEYAAHQKRYM